MSFRGAIMKHEDQGPWMMEWDWLADDIHGDSSSYLYSYSWGIEVDFFTFNHSEIWLIKATSPIMHAIACRRALGRIDMVYTGFFWSFRCITCLDRSWLDLHEWPRPALIKNKVFLRQTPFILYIFKLIFNQKRDLGHSWRSNHDLLRKVKYRKLQ